MVPDVTVLLDIAVEKVIVRGADVAPEIPVVPLVAMVLLAPELSKVPVRLTVGVPAEAVVKTKLFSVTAVPEALVAPLPTASVQEVLAGMAEDAVMVNAALVSPELTAAMVRV